LQSYKKNKRKKNGGMKSRNLLLGLGLPVS